MKRFSIFSIFVLGLASKSYGQQFDNICACGECCNVDNTTTFTGSTFKSLVYPSVSLYGTYTLIDYGSHRRLSSTERSFRSLQSTPGTPYQHVIRYTKEDGDGKFLYNFQLSSSTGTINCDDSHVYWRVMEDEVIDPTLTYTAGELKQIPLKKSDIGEFCEMDYKGIISMKMMEQPDEVYFAFNDLVNEGDTFYLQFSRLPHTLLEPIDTTLQYQYAIKPGSMAVQQVRAGGEFYMEVRFDVLDIETDVDPDPSCLSLDEVVSSQHAYFGSDSGGISCPVQYATAPVGDETTDVGRRYTLRFNQSQYEDCAESIVASGSTIDFSTTLRLLTGAVGENCFYFQPGSSEQEIKIQVQADVTEDVDSVFTQFSSELISITPQRCEPIADFIVPQVTLKVVLNVTFATVSGSSIERITSSIPYLEDPSFQLVPDTVAGGDSYVCTTTTSSAGDYVQCQYYFVTNKCERIYSTEGGDCALEYNTTRLIHDLVFKENYDGGLFVVRRSAPIPTGLQATYFDSALCEAKDEVPVIDVTDQFPSSIGLRNYFDGEPVDWTNTTQMSFNDKMIVRLGLGEEASATFDNVELFIKTVTVTLRDPNVPGRVINQATFNVREKSNLMGNSWMFFYTDPVFCSFYDSRGGVVPGGDLDPEHKCQSFYDPFDNELVRWTPHNTQKFGQAAIDDVCQVTRGADTRNTDFFMFDPKVWFADNVNAYMEVTVAVNGVLHLCGENQTIPTNRMLQAEDPSPDVPNPSSTVIVVTKEQVIVVGGPGDSNVVVSTGSSSSSMWEDNTALLSTLVAICSLLLLYILVVVGMKVCERYGKGDYRAATKSRIHDF